MCMPADCHLDVVSSTLRILISVSSLGPGGYFIGTVPDGRRVQDVLYRIQMDGRRRMQKELTLPLLKLAARWPGEAQPFGSAYNCSIGDTVTQGMGLHGVVA